MRKDDDAGNLIAFEGLLVALILLGAIYAAMATTQPATENPISRRELETTASDALIVLDGLREPRGRVLDVSIAEALDCAYGQKPSATFCAGARPGNLSYRMEGYLPTGAGYALAIDNGIESRSLHSAIGAGGERVSVSHAFTPQWNFTFLATDFSCYEPEMRVNVSLVPLRHGDTPTPRFIDAEAAGAKTNATASPLAGMWNASLPPEAIGESVLARVNASRGTYAGTTATSACDLGERGWDLRDGLNRSRAAALGPSGTPVVPIGSSATLTYDFEFITLYVPDATLRSVNATIYDPVPGRTGVADAYVVTDRIDLGEQWMGTTTWTPPLNSFFGHHPVLVTALLEVPNGAGGTTEVEIRLTTLVTVALASGITPLDPPYRAILEVWMPDWG